MIKYRDICDITSEDERILDSEPCIVKIRRHYEERKHICTKCGTIMSKNGTHWLKLWDYNKFRVSAENNIPVGFVNIQLERQRYICKSCKVTEYEDIFVKFHDRCEGYTNAAVEQIITHFCLTTRLRDTRGLPFRSLDSYYNFLELYYKDYEPMCIMPYDMRLFRFKYGNKYLTLVCEIHQTAEPDVLDLLEDDEEGIAETLSQYEDIARLNSINTNLNRRLFLALKSEFKDSVIVIDQEEVAWALYKMPDYVQNFAEENLYDISSPEDEFFMPELWYEISKEIHQKLDGRNRYRNFLELFDLVCLYQSDDFTYSLSDDLFRINDLIAGIANIEKRGRRLSFQLLKMKLLDFPDHEDVVDAMNAADEAAKTYIDTIHYMISNAENRTYRKPMPLKKFITRIQRFR